MNEPMHLASRPPHGVKKREGNLRGLRVCVILAQIEPSLLSNPTKRNDYDDIMDEIKVCVIGNHSSRKPKKPHKHRIWGNKEGGKGGTSRSWKRGRATFVVAEYTVQ